MTISVDYELKGLQDLADELERLDDIKFDEIVKNNLTEMYNRGKNGTDPKQGGTPVSKSSKVFDWKTKSSYQRTGGQLKQSLGVDFRLSEVYYTKDYAPHVEFGHRQNVGQYVPAIGKRLVKSYVKGQHFLKNNLKKQQSIFKEDLEKALNDSKT